MWVGMSRCLYGLCRCMWVCTRFYDHYQSQSTRSDSDFNCFSIGCCSPFDISESGQRADWWGLVKSNVVESQIPSIQVYELVDLGEFGKRRACFECPCDGGERVGLGFWQDSIYLRHPINAFSHCSDNHLERNDTYILCNSKMCCLLVWNTKSGQSRCVAAVESISCSIAQLVVNASWGNI